MRRWLIIIACGVANIASAAQGPATGATPPASPVPAIETPGPIIEDGSIRDSLGTVTIRPVPEGTEKLPLYLERVDYLRKHNDTILAIAYLRQLLENADMLPRYRARAILELADCLSIEHQEAEALCWLKIWTELYPARPEFGAVAYRIGTVYMQMGLHDLARDALYMALAHTINQSQVQNNDDLKHYSRLTEGTLWALANNEYQGAQWARGAELFARYRQEAPSASPVSLEKAAFLQADCYYQLKQIDNATNLYEETLRQHPFNPLAPEARLRLYHLYTLKSQPEKAKEELESLVWTVRTVWPQDEASWQKKTAEFLLALNKNNGSVLPPLLQEFAKLPPEGKTWQETLDHYDALVSYQAVQTRSNMDSPDSSPTATGNRHHFVEEDDLLALSREMDELLPAPQTASTQ
jgi:tetratricopeptide (TPR) repeat protein